MRWGVPEHGPVSPDETFIAICDRYIADLAALNHDTDNVGDSHPLWTAYRESKQALAATTPITLAGVAAKARVALAEAGAQAAYRDELWEGAAARLAGDVTKDLLRVSNMDGSPDAALIKLAEEILTNSADLARMDTPDENTSVGYMEEFIYPRVLIGHQKRDQLVGLVATTMDGFRAKARVLRDFSTLTDGFAERHDEEAIAWSLANDLLGVPSVWVVSAEED
jgi:hypothetical protein